MNLVRITQKPDINIAEKDKLIIGNFSYGFLNESRVNPVSDCYGEQLVRVNG